MMRQTEAGFSHKDGLKDVDAGDARREREGDGMEVSRSENMK